MDDAVAIRDLTSLDEFREVERLEQEIWGPVDLVPVPLLSVGTRRGAVLVGAFDGGRLVGFVYSFPAIRTRQPSHWSHMLGVHPDWRGRGLGRRLKLVQRERVLAMGLDLVEWSFDPLQAVNAYLNVVRLGVVAAEYLPNLYGESASPLHGGLPTDRLVAQWWIRSERVAARVASPAPVPAVEAVPAAVVTAEAGDWLTCVSTDIARTEPCVRVDVPAGFTRMLAERPQLARRWREVTGPVFAAYLGRGYQVVDFAWRAGGRAGAYVLARA